MFICRLDEVADAVDGALRLRQVDRRLSTGGQVEIAEVMLAFELDGWDEALARIPDLNWDLAHNQARILGGCVQFVHCQILLERGQPRQARELARWTDTTVRVHPQGSPSRCGVVCVQLRLRVPAHASNSPTMPSALTALVAAVVLLTASPVHGLIDEDSLRPAVRGEAKVGPPGPEYPVGTCDRIVPGAEGLSGPTPMKFMHIGSSVLGRPIWAEYWGPPSPERVIVMVSQIHGNECAPQRLVRAVRTTELRHVGIWLIPSLNPDGAASGSRLNAIGIDLNADGWTRSQPETRALMALTAQVHPALTVHVHSPNGGTGWFGDAAAKAAALTIAIETSHRCGAAVTFDVAGERVDPDTLVPVAGPRRHRCQPNVLARRTSCDRRLRGSRRVPLSADADARHRRL